MSKKSRRQRRLNLPPEAYNVPAAVATRPAAPPAGSEAAPVKEAREAVQRRPAQAGRTAQGGQPAPINWQAEYGEVLGDLKRTGVLAAIIMAAMIGLSFIIH